MSARLDELVDALERTAAELRSGELDPDRAAVLVEACSRLAVQAGSELDAEVRAGEETGSAQLPLG